MPKLKILTVIGTRPEIIRLSRVMSLLDQFVNHIIVHTGQNYDYELNEIFYTELELRKPDYFLNVDTSSLGSAVGDIIRKTEEVLKLEKPDALLVLGDTNSCLAAYIAKRPTCYRSYRRLQPGLYRTCTPPFTFRRTAAPTHIPHRQPDERSAQSLYAKDQSIKGT